VLLTDAGAFKLRLLLPRDGAAAAGAAAGAPPALLAFAASCSISSSFLRLASSILARPFSSAPRLPACRAVSEPQQERQHVVVQVCRGTSLLLALGFIHLCKALLELTQAAGLQQVMRQQSLSRFLAATQ
jgi:hypothetical protein